MQTYTHAFFGVAAGNILFPDNYLAQGVFVAGSVLPDVPDAIKMAIDKVKGKKPFTDLKKSLLAGDIAHSLFVWLAMVVVYVAIVVAGQSGWESLYPFCYPFCVGGLLHWSIDMLTHAEERFKKTDNKLFWPIGVVTKGVWEYRYDHGILRPKPFELFVCLSLFLYIGYRVYTRLAILV